MKHNEEVFNGKVEVAEAFGNFFCKIGRDISAGINASNVHPNTFLEGSHLHSALFNPASENEIIEIIAGMRNSSAGHDLIRPQLIKDNFVSLVSPITHIVNLSIAQGIVPEQFKIAQVTPVFKTGRTECINNYRPISVLSALSKILEKVVHKRMMSFFNMHSILSNNQFGFRSKHSCDQPLILATDFIREALDAGDHVIAVFLDLRKAFDVVSHPILLGKLSHYGLRGIPLQWLESYLSGRSQSVKIAGHVSSPRTITHGVPQGSVLGPLLFLVLINDLKIRHPDFTKIFLFADDTTVLIRHRSINSLVDTTNLELSHLCQWFKSNRLSVNVDKTKFMFFTLHSHLRYQTLSIIMDNVPIQRTASTKFLGVHFDELLSWDAHITYIASKISKSIGIIKKVCNTLPKSSCILLYKALILPYLSYCHVIWGCASRTRLQRLNLLQKRAIRVITHTHYRAHTEPLFLSCKLLPFFNLYDYYCLILLYKILKGMLPFTFNSKFSLEYAQPSRNPPRTHQHRQLQLPRFRTATGQRSLCHYLAKIHNEFAAPLNLIDTHSSFSHYKRQLVDLLL